MIHFCVLAQHKITHSLFPHSFQVPRLHHLLDLVEEVRHPGKDPGAVAVVLGGGDDGVPEHGAAGQTRREHEGPVDLGGLGGHRGGREGEGRDRGEREFIFLRWQN